jgi:hypothetical protein
MCSSRESAAPPATAKTSSPARRQSSPKQTPPSRSRSARRVAKQAEPAPASRRRRPSRHSETTRRSATTRKATLHHRKIGSTKVPQTDRPGNDEFLKLDHHPSVLVTVRNRPKRAEAMRASGKAVSFDGVAAKGANLLEDQWIASSGVIVRERAQVPTIARPWLAARHLRGDGDFAWCSF